MPIGRPSKLRRYFLPDVYYYRFDYSFRAQWRYVLLFVTFSAFAVVFVRAIGGGKVKGGRVDAGAVRIGREREAREMMQRFPPLDELVDRDSLWPPNLDKPLCHLKIYVYDLPVELSLTAAETAQCRSSVYSSELLLHSLLVNASSTSPISSMITTDISLAGVFFIPLFPACYLFNCWVGAGSNRSGRCGVDEKYIEPVMHWIQQQPPWKKHGGKDHLIVHPMDFVDGYYKESSRALMNESVHLVTVGDLRPPPYSQHYRRHEDIVIPSATHLLHTYYLNPRDYLDKFGHPILETLPEVQEFRRDKVEAIIAEIFDPTPRRMKEGGIWNSIFGGKNRRNSNLKTKRTTTAIFRGETGIAQERESYSLSIRSLFFPSSTHAGFSSLPHYDIAVSSPNHEHAYALSKSRFGLVPPGHTLDTTRLWEYLAFGVVPVFIGTGNRGGQVLPFQDDFDYDSFSLFIPREKAHLLQKVLESISEERYEELRKEVWKVGRLLVLENSRGNVWKWIGRDLCRTVKNGIEGGSRTEWI